jgi:Putative metallopeptidase
MDSGLRISLHNPHQLARQPIVNQEVRFMTRFLTAVALALPLGLITDFARLAAAEPMLTNDMITIEYHAPRSEKYVPIYERLQKRKILEELAEFVSPLELDSMLTLSLEEGSERNCKEPNSYYDGGGTLHLCYSWFNFLEKEVGVKYKRDPGEPFTATSLGLMPGVTRAEVLIGGTIDVVLHELGHAVFDLDEIPRFGREEDAADQFAALLMLQFGDKVALTTIKGAYNEYHHSNAVRLRRDQIAPRDEADEHSLDIQRAYNYLCMAYGKNPTLFEGWAALLPRMRRDNCADEYKQAEFAFAKTIMPRLNQAKVELVKKMQFLKPEDFQTDF